MKNMADGKAVYAIGVLAIGIVVGVYFLTTLPGMVQTP